MNSVLVESKQQLCWKIQVSERNVLGSVHVKGLVHPKMASFTRSRFIPNLYDFEHKRRTLRELHNLLFFWMQTSGPYDLCM